MNAAAANGLYLTKMIEPAPVLAADPGLSGAATAEIPRMMVLRLENLGG